jgi:hypothetical protein
MNSMRIVLSFVILFFSVSGRAQTNTSSGFPDSLQIGSTGNTHHSFQSILNKKWFFSTYGGYSTGFNIFNGGNATFVGAPLGLQLNRRLNNNVYAFAGISAVPSYINFNRSFLSAGPNKSYPDNNFFNTGHFGVYPMAEMGLLYINDARTFSLSGSISVQQSNYPQFPYQPISNARPIFSPNR